MLKTGTTAIVASSRCVQSRNPRAARIWGPEITTASSFSTSRSRSLPSHAPNAAPGAVRSYAASPAAAPCTLPWRLRPRVAAVPWQASWREPLRNQPAKGWNLCQPARRSAGADLCVRGEWTCLRKIQSRAAHGARASAPTVDDAPLTAPEFTRCDAVLHGLLHLLEGGHLNLAHTLAAQAELLGEFCERSRVLGEPARFEDAPLALVEHGERRGQRLATVIGFLAFR